MSKKILKYLLSFLVSIIIVFILVRDVRVVEIGHRLREMNFSYGFLMVFFYFLMLIGRTYRYLLFFRKDIRFQRMFSIVNLYNCVNEFLPFRSGELSYLYLMRKEGIEAGRNVASLILVRFFDFLSVVLFAFVALGILLSSGVTMFGIERYVWILPLLFLGGCLVFSVFILYFQKIIDIAVRILNRLPFISPWARWFGAKTDEVIRVLRIVWTKKFLWQMISRSLFIWIAMTLAFFFLFRSLGVPLRLVEMFFLIAFPALAMVLPVQGAANVGTFEAAMTVGFLTLGMDKQVAIPAGFAAHSIILLLAIGVGLVGLLGMKKIKK